MFSLGTWHAVSNNPLLFTFCHHRRSLFGHFHGDPWAPHPGGWRPWIAANHVISVAQSNSKRPENRFSRECVKLVLYPKTLFIYPTLLFVVTMLNFRSPQGLGVLSTSIPRQDLSRSGQT